MRFVHRSEPVIITGASPPWSFFPLPAAVQSHSPAHGVPGRTHAQPHSLAAGVVEKWPAFTKWSLEYLAERAGDTTATVDLTPNGLGDAVLRTEAGTDVFGVSACACRARARVCVPRVAGRNA